jgi:hypothetical protein
MYMTQKELSDAIRSSTVVIIVTEVGDQCELTDMHNTKERADRLDGTMSSATEIVVTDVQ